MSRCLAPDVRALLHERNPGNATSPEDTSRCQAPGHGRAEL